jgi:hypothetical protein
MNKNLALVLSLSLTTIGSAVSSVSFAADACEGVKDSKVVAAAKAEVEKETAKYDETHTFVDKLKTQIRHRGIGKWALRTVEVGTPPTMFVTFLAALAEHPDQGGASSPGYSIALGTELVAGGAAIYLNIENKKQLKALQKDLQDYEAKLEDEELSLHDAKTRLEECEKELSQ